MSNMVERVARAIHDEGFEDKDQAELEWKTWPDAKPYALKLARAAIEALREPTEGMISAHHIVPDDNDFRERAIANWQGLIDEALSEAP